jgi:hypothetical protein
VAEIKTTHSSFLEHLQQLLNRPSSRIPVLFHHTSKRLTFIPIRKKITIQLNANGGVQKRRRRGWMTEGNAAQL